MGKKCESWAMEDSSKNRIGEASSERENVFKLHSKLPFLRGCLSLFVVLLPQKIVQIDEQVHYLQFVRPDLCQNKSSSIYYKPNLHHYVHEFEIW